MPPIASTAWWWHRHEIAFRPESQPPADQDSGRFVTRIESGSADRPGSASDDVIWHHAKLHGFDIVTQDADFVERSRLQGLPPKVVWLRCGNRSAVEIEQILRRNHGLLQELECNADLHWLEIYG